ncbi:amidohydrolase family protein [Gynurincola endophyticus]|uniref:amidohydrolase family protein n=1 Tax=Gynurincola endophyticus TaxID=2479004 RepID=UPI000F8C79A2|nr:amidohydrolase family protein [Gynurincola endophyticus]
MKYILLLFLVLAGSQLQSQTYITNVAVADVALQKILPGMTVVIDKELITAIQPVNKIKIPAGATVIDGSGKYLLPGLTDAHIHFFQNGGLYTRPDVIDLQKYIPHHKELSYAHQQMEKVLRRYLRQGITQVIDVGSSYSFLEQANNFRGKDFAPEISITGPLLTTYEPAIYKNTGNESPFTLIQSAQDAVEGVRKQLPYKPDFIKIWFITTEDELGVEASARKNLPMVKAAIDEAHKHHLKVAIHTTQRIAAQLAVESGADFLVHSVEDEVVDKDFIQLLKKNNIIYSPTLIVHNNYITTFAQKHRFSNEQLLSSDPYQLGSLSDLQHLSDTLLVNNYKRSSEQMAGYLHSADSIRAVNLKLLSDAGVIIATGTDAGNIGTLHTSSYISELQAMSKSGMSNWQILTASTLNGAKVLGKDKVSGTISVGKQADLILLEANPVEKIENITRINRVIRKGKVHTPAELLEDTPEDLAQRQLNAYNLKNIDAFLEPYAEEVEIYQYPDKLLAKGKKQMRGIYEQMFKSTPDLHCELTGRIAQGNIVIDKERVRVNGNFFEAIAIYHIENNKISKVYFIQ